MSTEARRSDLVALSITGIAVVVCALLALATLQYSMPPKLYPILGRSFTTVEHYRSHLCPWTFTKLGVHAYIIRFRSLLALAWMGYILAVVSALKGGLPRSG
jgi:hypothetical protein